MTTIFTATRIGDVSKHVTVGFVGSMAALFTATGVPLLRGQNVQAGRFDLTNLKFVSRETHLKWKKSALLPGDVVLVRVGYPGTAAVIPHGVGDLNAASLVIVRPDPEKVDAQYLCAVLNSPWGKSRIAGLLVGSAQQVLNTKTVAEFEVPLPGMASQRRIAGILSAYDDLIENCERRIRVLDEMARSLYREWFVDFRFPGNTRQSGAPPTWKLQPCSAVAEFINGFAFKPSHWGDAGKPIIKIRELKAGITSETPRNAGDSIPTKYHVGDGHLLFSWSADLDVYLWRGGEGLLNQHLFDVTPTNGVSKDFLFHALREAMPRFRAMSLGATMHHIKRSALDQVSLLMPDKAIATAFDGVVQPMHRAALALQQRVQNLRATRDLLLPRLLSGQLSLDDAA